MLMYAREGDENRPEPYDRSESETEIADIRMLFEEFGGETSHAQEDVSGFIEAEDELNTVVNVHNGQSRSPDVK